MAETSKISWTDSTFNPWIGCAKVSPGCDFCYAEVSSPSRTLKINWGPREPRHLTSNSNWNLPKRWNNQYEAFYAEHGRRQRVFCASLADVFDVQADPAWRAKLWELIKATPNLDWLILTKRVGNVKNMLPADWGKGYPNVWLGISVVNQTEADRDIPKLLEIPAAMRWLSMEPLLGPVVLPTGFVWLDWVIVGGESGPNARPMNPEWVYALHAQCTDRAMGVPFFFKQWGGTTADKGGFLLNGIEVKEQPRGR